MVLVTGPTGSGKTSTLYSSIARLNAPAVNIMTAEDPVEFNLPGVNQVQIREQIGLTFAAALRSFLRQDPNVILVGEIRDGETAEVAVKAALTGHLVLSTLHTNDAPGTVARLLNMGIESFLVAGSLNLVCAQRLVRGVCPRCAEPAPMPPEALARIGFSERAAAETVPRAGRGCGACNDTGYKGRVGLFEVMALSPALRSMILAGAASHELGRQALEEGMLTLRQSGLQKVAAGVNHGGGGPARDERVVGQAPARGPTEGAMTADAAGAVEVDRGAGGVGSAPDRRRAAARARAGRAAAARRPSSADARSDPRARLQPAQRGPAGAPRAGRGGRPVVRHRRVGAVPVQRVPAARRRRRRPTVSCPSGFRRSTSSVCRRFVRTLTGLANGLVLVTGPTGSGKSTTLAALVDTINTERRGHILTIEDPIEFVHAHKRSIVNQREVHTDCASFGSALRAALREDPDVVLIGEMRDRETMEVALRIAETGHLTLATLHTGSAVQTINRVVDMFPAGQQQQVRSQLAAVLEGLVCQTLVAAADGAGRVAAAEVMVATPAIRNLIRDGKNQQVYSMLQTGQDRLGMQTMNQSLAALVGRGRIALAAALARSSNRDELQEIVRRSRAAGQPWTAPGRAR